MQSTRRSLAPAVRRRRQVHRYCPDLVGRGSDEPARGDLSACRFAQTGAPPENGEGRGSRVEFVRVGGIRVSARGDARTYLSNQDTRASLVLPPGFICGKPSAFAWLPGGGGGWRAGELGDDETLTMKPMASYPMRLPPLPGPAGFVVSGRGVRSGGRRPVLHSFTFQAATANPQ
jgi:hypothetical protein